MIVALEGMDGCGKTTIARKISEDLGYTYANRQLKNIFNLSKEQFEEACQRIYDINDSTLSALFFTLNNYVSMIKDKNVILDRHFISTCFWNYNERTSSMLNMLSNIVRPDITIFLLSSIEKRRQHIGMREGNNLDIYDVKKMSYGYDEMIHYAQKLSFNYIVVHEDDMQYEEIIAVCKKIICSAEKLNNKELKEFCSKYENITSIDNLDDAKVGVEI